MSDEANYAKAIEEASKLGRDLVANAAALEGIATRLFGPIGQGYGLLADLVRHKREELEWRHRNRMSVCAKVAAALRVHQTPLAALSPIPTRISIGYEEGLEREDDDDLQALWANLLVNLTKPDRVHTPLKIYGDLLSRMDHDQALLLNEIGLRKHYASMWFLICDAVDRTGKRGVEISGNTNDDWNDEDCISTEFLQYRKGPSGYFCPWTESRFEVTVDSLTILGLLRRMPYIHEDMVAADEGISPSEDFAELSRRILNSAKGVQTAFHLTELGKVFIDIVTPAKVARTQSKPRVRKRRARSTIQKS